MTEQEWLSCADPKPMLEFLKGKASERKLRLFAVACCRRRLGMMADRRNQLGVEMTEKHADGIVSGEELAAVAEKEVWAPVFFAAKANAALAAWFAARDEAYDPFEGSAKNTAWDEVKENVWNLARSAASLAQAELMRDIFGNPFGRVTFDSSWVTVKVKTIAQENYDDRSFDRLPALADAFEEAGCTNAEILSHCRGPGPHVRGCWVVDSLLGKG